MADEFQLDNDTFIEGNIQSIWLIESLTSPDAIFSEACLQAFFEIWQLTSTIFGWIDHGKDVPVRFALSSAASIITIHSTSCSGLFMAPPEPLPVRPTHPQVELSLFWTEALRHIVKCKSSLQKRVILSNQNISWNLLIQAGSVFNNVCSSLDPKQIIIAKEYQTYHS